MKRPLKIYLNIDGIPSYSISNTILTLIASKSQNGLQHADRRHRRPPRSAASCVWVSALDRRLLVSHALHHGNWFWLIELEASMASTCWVSVYSEISCVNQMILVMDWVQYIGTRNMDFGFWKRFQKGKVNKAFLHILPNFWHTAIVWRQIPKEYDQRISLFKLPLKL